MQIKGLRYDAAPFSLVLPFNGFQQNLICPVIRRPISAQAGWRQYESNAELIDTYLKKQRIVWVAFNTYETPSGQKEE